VWEKPRFSRESNVLWAGLLVRRWRSGSNSRFVTVAARLNSFRNRAALMIVDGIEAFIMSRWEKWSTPRLLENPCLLEDRGPEGRVRGKEKELSGGDTRK